MQAKRTVIEIFEKSVQKFGTNTFFREKTKDVYESTNFKQMHHLVWHLASGLYSLGLRKGDSVALLSQGRRDWLIAELAVIYNGAINVPLSTKLETADLEFRIIHAECKYLIVSAQQYPKLRASIAKLPQIERVILFDEEATYTEKEILMETVFEMGTTSFATNKPLLQSVIDKITEDDVAILSYTSGTSASPKGVMLSHKNLYANTEQSYALFPIHEHYCCLLTLPLDHSFTHTCCMYVFMKAGASLASVQHGRNPAEALRNLPINFKEVKPTLSLSVPALAKNFKKAIEKGVKDKGSMAEKMFNRGMSVARKFHGDGWNRGRVWRWLYYPSYRLYDKLVFSKVRQQFGGQLELFVGGGALLDSELQHFYFGIGIPMYQGYGLTEASPVISANRPGCCKIGSSGTLVPWIELKICDENGKQLPLGQKGEIVIKGDNVMVGYFKNTEATQEMIKDGWLHTGDMGYMDKDGFLYVVGRFKSLLISSDGEKYSPEGYENMLPEKSKYVEQVMLYNNQSQFTIALLCPNKPALLQMLAAKQIDPKSQDAITECLKAIAADLAQFKDGGQYASQFPQRWIPTAIAVLPESFTEENRMLNSTLKMVRHIIVDCYKPTIDACYSAEGKDFFNESNRKAMRTVLG